MDRRLTIHIFAVIFNIVIVLCFIEIFTIILAIMSQIPNNEDIILSIIISTIYMALLPLHDQA